jgi:hypothetical protein
MNVTSALLTVSFITDSKIFYHLVSVYFTDSIKIVTVFLVF